VAKRTNFFQKSSKAAKEITGESVYRILTLSITAFGFVVALAWSAVIQELLSRFIDPLIPGQIVLSRFIYAILVTVLAAVVIYQLTKISVRNSEK